MIDGSEPTIKNLLNTIAKRVRHVLYYCHKIIAEQMLSFRRRPGMFAIGGVATMRPRSRARPSTCILLSTDLCRHGQGYAGLKKQSLVIALAIHDRKWLCQSQLCVSSFSRIQFEVASTSRIYKQYKLIWLDLLRDIMTAR